MKPSIDRINNNKGYSFDNIQIMTWAENKAKGHRDHKSCKLQIDQKPTCQFSLDGKLIKEYPSQSQASRETKIHKVNISKCCLGKREVAGGYRWEFKNKKDNK